MSNEDLLLVRTAVDSHAREINVAGRFFPWAVLSSVGILAMQVSELQQTPSRIMYFGGTDKVFEQATIV